MAPDDAHITIHDLQSPKNGYERLAAHMGNIPERAIFRRFTALNAKNILYYQAELAWLEERLAEQIEADHQSDDDTRQQYGQWWYKLSHSERYSCGSSKQWEIFQNIRRILHDYSQTQKSAVWRCSLLTSTRRRNSAAARDGTGAWTF